MISLEKQRALKRAERDAAFHRRMRAIAQLPEVPDPRALVAFDEAVRRDDARDRYAGPAGSAVRPRRSRGAELAGTGN